MWSGMSHSRAEKKLPERTGRYRAVSGAQVSFVCYCKILCRFYTATHSCRPSRPFNVIEEKGWEGSMARRAERRLSERAGRYRASVSGGHG